MNLELVAHTVQINGFKVIHNEHLKGVGELIESLA